MSRIGYFKTELINQFPLYTERTAALISMFFVKYFITRLQPNKKIYESFENTINSINLSNWIFLYIFFEINLIKELGYDTNLAEYFNEKIILI